MHLSDQELMELDSSGKLHLSECEHCQQKLNNLNQFREKFSQLPKMSMSKSGWQWIKRDYLYELKENENERVKNQLLFWRASSLSMAASLLVLVLWQTNSDESSQIGEQSIQLSHLIEINQLLQSEYSQYSQNHFSNVAVIELSHELELIDLSLRDAYEQKLTYQEKANLWHKRKQLLKQILSMKQKRQIIAI